MLIDFETHRPFLFGIAYRMTGSAADAEDLVQEAFLRATRTNTDAIDNPRSWLASIVTRLALDLLKSARRTREEYIGPWLPEPLIVDRREERDLESISFAFMTLLELLAPEERAVLLMRDVFQYEFDEIGEIVGKTAGNCRQILHRARARLREESPRFQPSRDEHRKLVDGFLASLRDGDPEHLAGILAPNVRTFSDGGGKVTAARRPIEGRDAVIRFLLGIRRLAPDDASLRPLEINGEPAIVIFVGSVLQGAIFVESDAGHITAVRFVVNPDKLQHLRREIESPS